MKHHLTPRVRGAAVGLMCCAMLACAGSPLGTTSTSLSTTTTAADTTTSAGGITTMASTSTEVPITTVPPVPEIEFPVDGPCSMDALPDGGEITVLVGERVLGIGADGATVHCLVTTAPGSAMSWGPLGDRLRAGDTIYAQGTSLDVPGDAGIVWTTPTGKRVVIVRPDRVTKVDVDGGAETDITFLTDNSALSYHPAGTHLLVVGVDGAGQYGMWLANNLGEDPLLLAFDESAQIVETTWNWMGEPLFVAAHSLGPWHIHRVDLTEEGGLDGPVVVESDDPIDRLLPSPFDPVLLAYRSGGSSGVACVEGERTTVVGVDLPEPLASMQSSPVGWLPGERLVVLTHPSGCELPGDVWVFSAGFCPGSTYGALPVVGGVDGAAVRVSAPEPPPPPDFGGLIDPAPA